jgi:hypothetical protein
MKKAKRSFELEENELDYSKDLGIELDDDDEIIDLEEIVEMPEESDEDDLSLDVELLDVDSDLDLSDLDSKLKGSGTEDILDDEFLKEFSFGDADEKAEEPAPKQQQREEVDILGQGSVDDLLKEFSFPDEETGLDLGAAPKSGSAGGGSSGGRLKSVVDNEVFREPQKAVSPPVVEEPKSVEPAVAVAAAAAVGVGVGSVGMSGAGAAGLDDLITQLENRLLETIRQMVESRLPDIVRTVLREEIEKLKREL